MAEDLSVLPGAKKSLAALVVAMIVVAAVFLGLGLTVGNRIWGGSGSSSGTVPAVCIAALNDAEAIVQSSSSAMSITSDLVTATANGDTASINDLNNQISSLIPGVKILVAAYTTDSATCRALKS